MADAGVGEAAIAAAAAESAAAATAAGGTLSAMLAATPELFGGGAAALGGTAAAAAPTVAAAVPSLALAAPEALTVPTAAQSLVSVGPEALTVPTAAEAQTAAPISLLSTQSEPVTGGLLGSVGDYPLPGSAADFGSIGTTTGAEQFGPPTANLLDKLSNWWETSSLGDKLSAGGKVLGAVGSAAKAATPTTPQTGPKTTLRPGTTGKPQGGEQALAAVVEALLKRRDAYTGAQYGVPVAYRPRGLLG